jgi:hypothetical protein
MKPIDISHSLGKHLHKEHDFFCEIINSLKKILEGNNKDLSSVMIDLGGILISAISL